MKLAQMKIKEIYYLNNPETGYFEKQPMRQPFQKMPFELKVEPTQVETIKRNGAREVLCSRKVKSKYSFLTGLIPMSKTNWFVGNDYKFVKGKKIISLLIIQFSEDSSALKVYYFSRFYPDYPNERERLVIEFIEHKKRENDLPLCTNENSFNPIIDSQI